MNNTKINNTNTIFYMIYFESSIDIKRINDFLLDEKASIKYSKPYYNKEKLINRVNKYDKVCIIYNALKQTYLNDPRHAKYDINIIHILVLWAKKNIRQEEEKAQPTRLETILEEDEFEVQETNRVNKTDRCESPFDGVQKHPFAAAL